MMTNTKMDMNHNRIARMEGLDELARVLFPGNRVHQRIFLAVFVELKWSRDQFMPALNPVAAQHAISLRTLETVRAKMRRLGLIDHVSRFNQRYGYREGWVFSRRFEKSLALLADQVTGFRGRLNPRQEAKDRDIHHYL